MSNIFKHFSLYATVFARIIQRDFQIFWPIFKRRVINVIVWTILVVYVFEYVGLGSATGLGMFIACSESIGWGFTAVTTNVMRMVADIRGDNAISYYLSLPVPHYVIFLTNGISNGLQLMSIGIFGLITAWIVLWNSFSFAKVSFLKLGLIFFVAHIFYGFFSVLIASKLDSVEAIYNVRGRLLHPLWLLGGFFVTWQSVYNMSPIWAYIFLLNPLVYSVEGMRAVVLGQAGYLNFWLCVGALSFLAVITAYFGIRGMLKRLDCIY